MAVDHYNTLGVMSTATAADLRAAYLKLARANHPDKFAGSQRDVAEAKMQQINEAWNVLGVAHKRREYDVRRPQSDGPYNRAERQRSAQRGTSRGHAHFKPFDDDPVTRADVDLDPTPIAGSKGIPRWVTFLPVILFAVGVLTLGFGTMVDASSVLALGVICLALGGVCFLMLPLIVMSRAERDPDV